MEIAPGIHDWMSPEEKLTRHRSTAPPPEKAPRPYTVKVELSVEERQEVYALPPTERLTRFRAIHAERGMET